MPPVQRLAPPWWWSLHFLVLLCVVNVCENSYFCCNLSLTIILGAHQLAKNYCRKLVQAYACVGMYQKCNKLLQLGWQPVTYPEFTLICHFFLDFNLISNCPFRNNDLGFALKFWLVMSQKNIFNRKKCLDFDLISACPFWYYHLILP